MSRFRRVGAILAVAAFAGSAATFTAAAPASAAVKDGPRPLVSAVKYVKSGKSTWVKAYWKTYRDVCDAKVTVSAEHVDVFYPSNTETYTSFKQDATLAVGHADYTAFNVTTESDRSKVIKLKVTITYTQLPRGTFGPGVDPEEVPCKGKELARITTIKLPVIGERDL